MQKLTRKYIGVMITFLEHAVHKIGSIIIEIPPYLPVTTVLIHLSHDNPLKRSPLYHDYPNLLINTVISVNKPSLIMVVES